MKDPRPEIPDARLIELRHEYSTGERAHLQASDDTVQLLDELIAYRKLVKQARQLHIAWSDKHGGWIAYAYGLHPNAGAVQRVIDDKHRNHRDQHGLRPVRIMIFDHIHTAVPR